jgi:hypothetical protein
MDEHQSKTRLLVEQKNVRRPGISFKKMLDVRQKLARWPSIKMQALFVSGTKALPLYRFFIEGDISENGSTFRAFLGKRSSKTPYKYVYKKSMSKTFGSARSTH